MQYPIRIFMCCLLLASLAGCSSVARILGGGSGKPDTADADGDDYESEGWQTNDARCPLQANALYGNFFGVAYDKAEENFVILCQDKVIKDNRLVGRCRNFEVRVETDEDKVSEHPFTMTDATYPDAKTIHFGKEGRASGEAPEFVNVTGYRCSK